MNVKRQTNDINSVAMENYGKCKLYYQMIIKYSNYVQEQVK